MKKIFVNSKSEKGFTMTYISIMKRQVTQVKILSKVTQLENRCRGTVTQVILFLRIDTVFSRALICLLSALNL